MTDCYHENYIYLKDDEPLGAKVAYYYDHLGNAKKAGHSCVADWVRALHAEHDGKASKVGAAMGVTYATVLRWFYNLCLPVRSKGGKDPMPHPRRGEAGSIYARTGSGIKTAVELGVSTRQAYKWLEQDNIPRKGKAKR